MSDLATRKCKPSEGGVAPYTAQQAKDMLKQLKGWIIEDGKIVLCDELSHLVHGAPEDRDLGSRTSKE